MPVTEFWIENGYLFRCRDAAGDVGVPWGVREIGISAFSRYGEITSMFLPDSVQQIEHGAFRECRGLKHIRLSSFLVKIGTEAFCTGFAVHIKQIICFTCSVTIFYTVKTC